MMIAQKKYIEFTLGSEYYALPIEDVQEIIRYQEIHRLPGSGHSMLGVIHLRETMIPVLSLARLVGSHDREITKTSRIIILKLRNQLLGITVDQVTRVSMYDTIQKPPADIGTRGLLTGLGQGEDRVVSIIHVHSLLDVII